MSKNAFAIVETGSKQYLMSEGDILDIELIEGKKGAINFDRVLLVSDGKNTEIGQPYVKSASVSAKILEPVVKDDKLIVFKFKKKTGYKKKNGHRQKLTRIRVENIGQTAKKSPAKKAEPNTEKASEASEKTKEAKADK